MSREREETLEDRVSRLKTAITCAAVKAGLSLTVYDGKIAFADREQRKIVAVWTKEFILPENGGNEHGA